MAETVREVAGLSKTEAWAVLLEETAAVLEGVQDEVTAMATIASLVHHGFHYLWTGFYRVVTPGKLLRVGPYQGTLGCLEIAFGKGVCGTAAAERRTVVVRDVLLPEYDVVRSRSRSPARHQLWPPTEPGRLSLGRAPGGGSGDERCAGAALSFRGPSRPRA